MLDIIPIVLGCLILIFHQQLANYYRNFGKEKNPPVKWKYAEEIIIIAGFILILKGLITFFNK
jgi:hypothetical protein